MSESSRKFHLVSRLMSTVHSSGSIKSHLPVFAPRVCGPVLCIIANTFFLCVSVSARDIKDLYRRFRRLDRTHAGYLTSNEFQLIPELSMNPLCERIIALFDEDRSDRVNFRRFVRTLAVFHPQTPVADKLNGTKLCFLRQVRAFMLMILTRFLY